MHQMRCFTVTIWTKLCRLCLVQHAQLTLAHAQALLCVQDHCGSAIILHVYALQYALKVRSLDLMLTVHAGVYS